MLYLNRGRMFLSRRLLFGFIMMTQQKSLSVFLRVVFKWDCLKTAFQQWIDPHGILNLGVSCFRLEIKTSHYMSTKCSSVLQAVELV